MIGRLFKQKNSESEPAPSAAKGATKGAAKGAAKGGKASGQAKAKGPKGDKQVKQVNSKPANKDGGSQKPRRQKRAPKAPKKPWDISQFQVPEAEGKTRFHDLKLHNDLMHGIADLGFQYCSPIQAQSLPHSLDGHDVVGKAQTGTGKTAAFLLTIIDDLLRNPIEGERFAGEARALIIAPTRELVIQIADDAKALVKHTDLKVHTLVGGMDYTKQQRKLENSLVDILVATPGRLLDFCGNRDVHLDQIEIMVIDEADRMLDMGFI
ncbi:MAG: DEAD/DEAH box helicase, partial [Cellvibrionaceae bacterium]|nr:DEAD/DEAH box helicase [Cellvibrionaceae bacterium]